MPFVTGLLRLRRLATLPETRRAIAAASRSEAVRDIARRAAHDRPALIRDLAHPANVRAMVRAAVRHPATHELAGAGLMFLPVRYLPLGVASAWVARRVLRRYTARPSGETNLDGGVVRVEPQPIR